MGHEYIDSLGQDHSENVPDLALGIFPIQDEFVTKSYEDLFESNDPHRLKIAEFALQQYSEGDLATLLRFKQIGYNEQDKTRQEFYNGGLFVFWALLGAAKKKGERLAPITEEVAKVYDADNELFGQKSGLEQQAYLSRALFEFRQTEPLIHTLRASHGHGTAFANGSYLTYTLMKLATDVAGQNPLSRL